MLEIDEAKGVAPTAGEAATARAAAQEALEKIRKERAQLPAQHAEAVSRGDFTSARATKDQMALLEDHETFAAGQLLRAELLLVTCELRDAEQDAREAVPKLEAAFRAQSKAQMGLDDATASVRKAQVTLGAAQARVQDLRQQYTAARLRVERAEQ